MSVSPFDPRPSADSEKRESVPVAADDIKLAALRSAVIGALLRMVVGPMTLFLSTFALVCKAQSYWTAADAFFGAGVAALLAGRWIEHRSGVADRADGKPASVTELLRYYLRIGVGALTLWLIASMIRTVWLTR
ncbi:MAG: hypothetical protein ACYC3I_23580 [Gemmataceae bacterium]